MLGAVALGEAGAAERLFPVVYDELRRLARSYLDTPRRDHTLQATALVHEAFLRLVDAPRMDWNDRAHFFAVAARALRHVLIDYERGRGRAKRGGGWRRVALEGLSLPDAGADVAASALHDALTRLGREHPEEERVIELGFFAGLTHEEIAGVIGVSIRTVERRWRFGRAWLYRELGGSGSLERPGRSGGA